MCIYYTSLSFYYTHAHPNELLVVYIRKDFKQTVMKLTALKNNKLYSSFGIMELEITFMATKSKPCSVQDSKQKDL